MPRVNPHFKVHTSIANHTKMIAVYADNKLLAMWLRLGLESIERFANNTDDAFIIHERELPALAGCERRDGAARLLHKLCRLSPVTCKHVDNYWTITFPNLQRKQGFHEKNRKVKSDSHSQSHSQSHKESQECSQAWIQAQEAAKQYGVKWGKLTPNRHRLVSSRLSEHREVGADVIAQAIRGYVALRKSDDFDWKAYLTPSTILRPSKFPTYLDAYRAPQPEGKTTQATADFSKKFTSENLAKPRRGK